jgi:DNA invertase Pin-like site-specific DNA recombinase
MKAIGYARTSTQKQDLSLEVQERRILAEGEFRGFPVEMISEKVSASLPPAKRPGLSRALEMLRTGEADTLVVAKLDRVARSSADIALLLESAKREGWNFIALDLGVDTSTPEGTLVVGIMASIAQWERARIKERTREALAVAKSKGVQLGRPLIHDESAAKRARALRRKGLSLAKVSSRLFDEGIKTGSGKPLSASQIKRMVEA